MKIKVAAIQINQNLTNRDKFNKQLCGYLNQAADKNVGLVLFPELFSTGYIPNYELWNRLAEGNQIISQLQAAAKKYNFYIGCGHIEVIDNDIFNTYVLINSKGEIEDKAIKENGEAYLFKRGKGKYILNTSLGIIGVGICADNHFCEIIEQIQNSNVVLHIMPHAWPTSVQKGNNASDFNRVNKKLHEFPIIIAKALGVPSVFINQIGEITQMAGILGKLMNPEVFKLQGCSKIINNAGIVLSELDSSEGIIVSEIQLKSSLQKSKIPNYDGWILEGSKLLRKIIIPFDIWRGEKNYKKELDSFLKKEKTTA